jgi:hypothetical protein
VVLAPRSHPELKMAGFSGDLNHGIAQRAMNPSCQSHCSGRCIAGQCADCRIELNSVTNSYWPQWPPGRITD